MSVRGGIRQAKSRIRRRLGLPRLRQQAWLLILAMFLGVLCLGAWVADFTTTLGAYAPQVYEPKDFARQRFLEGQTGGTP